MDELHALQAGRVESIALRNVWKGPVRRCGINSADKAKK
ncbi:hypothetical protein RISK_006261 [Rhodopirellula islandica]|uniref:Uncharacterized protein n=1 Tax=Rhodopirellula islandica TaxID=595434 RepID=A0A0J1B4V9_RHOIS|nr:hypothetical protein RISK_006261 [Rhodopirellula islandica]